MAQRLNVSSLDAINDLLRDDLLSDIDLSIPSRQFYPRYNLTPLSALWLVRKDVARLTVAPAIWGLIPPWAKPGQFPRPLTHARAETVFEKASFKNLIRRYRGVVIANGFYTNTARGRRGAPRYHFQESGAAVALGTVWQFNSDGNVETALLNRRSDGEGDRMPVLIPRLRLRDWFDVVDHETIAALLAQDPIDIASRPVSDHVRDPGNEGPACLEALRDP